MLPPRCIVVVFTKNLIKFPLLLYYFLVHSTAIVEYTRLDTAECARENQNAPRPSEHPPVRGEKCQNVVS